MEQCGEREAVNIVLGPSRSRDRRGRVSRNRTVCRRSRRVYRLFGAIGRDPVGPVRQNQRLAARGIGLSLTIIAGLGLMLFKNGIFLSLTDSRRLGPQSPIGRLALT